MTPPPLHSHATAGTRAPADVPVYDIRDRSATEVIAARLASGEPAAFYIGMYTIMQVVGPPGSRGATGSLFWQVKRERPTWSKLPVFQRPRDALGLIDVAAVHPDLRARIRRREAFSRLWDHGAPMHVVAPLRRGLRTVNEVLITTPDEAAATAADRAVPRRTAALFWMDDPDWSRLADALARRCRPRRFMVGSSFNDHGAHPPYTLAELHEHSAARADLAYGFIVHDALLERLGGHSSHSIVRLPLVGEDPALVMLRQGAVSPEWLTEVTGLPVVRLASTTTAVRRADATDGSLRLAYERLRAERSGLGASRVGPYLGRAGLNPARERSR